MSASVTDTGKKPAPAAGAEQRDAAPPSPQAQAYQRHLEQLHEKRFEKKGARRAFHLVNFLGFHQIFNNVTSVWIAYTLLTKPFAKRMMKWLGDSHVGKAADTVFSLPAKGVDGVLKIFGKSVNGHALSDIEKQIQKQHNARSSIETAFMCIAGFIALWPVKILEDHRAGFLNKVDNWLHPGRSKEEKKAAALSREDEPKETWMNLLRARIVALGAVFSVDRIQQIYNNSRGYGPGVKGNIDIGAWKLGARISDWMGRKPGNWLNRLRDGMVDFFARKKIGITSIQHMMRDHLLDSIGNISDEVKRGSGIIGKLQTRIDTIEVSALKALKDGKTPPAGNAALIEKLQKRIERVDGFLTKNHTADMRRAVFAEQSRLLFTKEIFLTTVMAVTIYTAAKARFMAKFFEKIGLQKKGTYDAEHAKKHQRKHKRMEAVPPPTPEPAPAAPLAAATADEPAARWAGREENRPKTGKEFVPAGSFQEALGQETGAKALPSF